LSLIRRRGGRDGGREGEIGLVLGAAINFVCLHCFAVGGGKKKTFVYFLVCCFVAYEWGGESNMYFLIKFLHHLFFSRMQLALERSSNSKSKEGKYFF